MYQAYGQISNTTGPAADSYILEPDRVAQSVGHLTRKSEIMGSIPVRPHCKKIHRFYGKIPGIWLPVLLTLLLQAFTCRTFLEIKIF